MEYFDDILELVKKKVEEQAAYDRDAYAEIVDETIAYFEEKGKLTPEDNTELLRDELMAMHETIQDQFVD